MERAKRKTKSQTKSRNEVFKLIRDIVFLMLEVIAVIIIVQIVVGKLMILIIGKEAFSDVVPTAIFSALTYLVAIVVLIWLPARLKNAWYALKSAKTRQSR